MSQKKQLATVAQMTTRVSNRGGLLISLENVASQEQLLDKSEPS